MTTDDEWLKMAMVEDTVVAEFLTALKDTPPSPLSPPPPPSTSLQQAFSCEWKVRQRRSKKEINNNNTTTASPTSPLSWSTAGGISGCAAAVEVEERSKVSGSCEVSTAKKCRKKKTLTQLREEEVTLERERRQLKRELESIRDNLERERTRNENFKRMKQQVVSFKPISRTINPIVVSNHGHGPIHQSSQNSWREGKMETAVGKFELPDLNLPLVSEENPCGL